jgi:flagellin
MISIQTNVNSLVAQQNLSVNSTFQSKTIAQLTSGYRINQSGDDAAGLAVANKFRSTVAELTQGVANGNDATAQLQIMDGGMSNISQILDRLKTLATQSASGTFTGNRVTVNSEFQNDLAEIDRQAQSIGLNTGGAFAKNLDVYLGQGSGSSSLQNGVVTLGLTQSAVDSQSLGMKGMQAVAGSIDLGGGSSTSVAQILANTTNSGSTATAGATDFYFAGPGFSDSSKVKVSVNLSGVTDTSSLVSAFNAAIAGAGNGTSQAGAAFAKANIVASVNTDSTGKQQLAFTSSTTAFQVEAGDRMANALMGNLSGTTGAAITTSVTGGNTAAALAVFNPALNQTVRIQGAGLSGPVDLTFNAGDTTVAGAVTDLVNKVSSNTALKAAGISLSGSAGSPLVFTSARGESFSVMATGDTTNQLGLGSFVTNGSASNAVDYKSITGAVSSYVTSANDQATLQFSINGAAATAVSVDLTAGDAVAASTKTSVINNPAIATGVNDTLTFSVDGIAVSATLSGAGEKAIATGNAVGGGLAITKATASNTTGVTVLASHDWSGANGESFTVNVNGAGAQTVYLTTNYTNGAGDGALLTAINNQLSGATATIVGNQLKFTATTPGAGSIVLGGTVANIGATWTTNAGANGNNKVMVAYNGGAAKEIDVLNGGANTTFTNTASLAAFQTALDTAFGANNVVASVTGGNLVLTDATVGPTSALTVSDLPTGLDTANSGMSTMFGGSTITAQGAATSAASIATTIQSAIDTATGTGASNAHATVTVNNDFSLTITNDHKGAAHTISAFAGTAATGVAGNNPSFLGVGASVVTGSNRSGGDLQNYLNQQFSSVAALQPAQLKATWSGGTLQIASGNNTNFRVNSGSTGSGVATGTADLSSGHAWGGGAEVFRLKVDGGALSANITLSNTTTDLATTLAEVNRALAAASVTNVTASFNGNNLVFTSNSNGATSNVQVYAPSAGTDARATLGMKSLEKTADADLGFGVSGASFGSTLSVSSPLNHTIDAGGASSANVNGNALSFSALKYGNDAQAITISANDVNGNQQATTITLKNLATGASTDNRAGRSIDEAISYINAQLQSSNNATLQKIVAVKENNSGDQINFVSSLSGFNVSVASTANADGVDGGASKNVAVGIVGTGANMAVDTQLGAQAAVTAIATAIGRLGSAQAAVGKGQNQLAYAVSLAQSQITNFSAAESQIRDANVAQQAANLSKAQVLSQASIAAMAQANSAPQAVLSLLRG